MHVYVRVCACVCTRIGELRMTNKQPRTKLSTIAVSKLESLSVMGGCPRRGKLRIQPPLGGHWLTVGDKPTWDMACGSH